MSLFNKLINIRGMNCFTIMCLWLSWIYNDQNVDLISIICPFNRYLNREHCIRSKIFSSWVSSTLKKILVQHSKVSNGKIVWFGAVNYHVIIKRFFKIVNLGKVHISERFISSFRFILRISYNCLVSLMENNALHGYLFDLYQGNNNFLKYGKQCQTTWRYMFNLCV